MTSNAAAVSRPEPQEALPVREQLYATHAVVVAAHDAPLREALESVRWERRGLLGRLTRPSR